ncbi:uncharacterized RNA-binding S4 domain protein [Desulfobacula toluolica Tol2]|uniref:Uncharacterized RNA-binding S4 domain protein n=2 Tax=Desulfobacula toluolica TaxID=28223 RepID=K0ND55_DESTT|nr:uncharacterized RNA-binding S4 domain protein [Desulfobacula toluolica Tol2]
MQDPCAWDQVMSVNGKKLLNCDKRIKMEKRVVNIKTEFVELYKILKFENLAASGGEAKYLINDGFVRVNGSVETRKRKKIVPGDIIETGGVIIEIHMQQQQSR